MQNFSPAAFHYPIEFCETEFESSVGDWLASSLQVDQRIMANFFQFAKFWSRQVGSFIRRL